MRLFSGTRIENGYLFARCPICRRYSLPIASTISDALVKLNTFQGNKGPAAASTQTAKFSIKSALSLTRHSKQLPTIAMAKEALYDSAFLRTPPTLSPEISEVDFEKEGIPQYARSYAVVIDGLFSAEECSDLVSVAVRANKGIWDRALVDVGGAQQVHMPDIRNCGRIIYDDTDLAERMWQRLWPHLSDILQVRMAARRYKHGCKIPTMNHIAAGLNERLRFLSYGPGEYFERHFDGRYSRQIQDSEDEEFSLYTIHLYLNDGNSGQSQDEKLVGGSTNFFTPGVPDGEAVEVRVKPKMGRVLVFQQAGLLHSGEEVLQGRKLTMRTDIMYRVIHN